MSTRACIAKITGNASWEGVYIHNDGYPSSVGATIWRIVQHQFINSSNQVAPWVAIRAFCDIYITGHPAGWSIFAEQCYCHEPYFVIRDRLESFAISSNNTEELLSLEWVYILDPKTETLTVLHHRASDTADPVKVATINLYGPEPDWRALEARAGRSLTQTS